MAEDIKVRTQFSIAQPSYVRPKVNEVKLNGGYNTYGGDNLYPEYLLNIYYGCSQHQGIVQRKIDEILGKGLYSESGNATLKAFINRCNDKGQTLMQVLRKEVNDYEIFGGFAMQIVWGKGSTEQNPILAGIHYVDIGKLRWNYDYTKLKYSKHWGNSGKIKTATYNLYDPKNPVGTQIYYYSGTMTREWYPVPQYIGSIPAIETAIDIANFNKSTLKNGFFPSLSITFYDGEPTEEQKSYIERALQEKWGGTSNTGRFMISYADKDGQGPSITPIAQPDLDKMFAELKTSVIEDIFIGHRITDPTIFGLAIAGKLGNSNYNQSYAIFQNVYVKPQREIIMAVFNEILSHLQGLKIHADLEVTEIEPINNVLSDEGLIASQMTQKEIRTILKRQGYIETVEIPEGEQTLAQTPTEPVAEDPEEDAEEKPESSIKVTKPTVKV